MGGPGFNIDTETVTAAKVGIGVPVPAALFHVLAGNITEGPLDPSVKMILENNDHVGLQFLTPNNKNAIILFGDPELSTVGQIDYLHSTNTMRFTTNNSVKMAIDGGGNVGIGTPTPASLLHMKVTGGTGWSPLTIEAENSVGVHGANALEFRRSRSAGADAIAYDDLGNIFFSFRKAEAPPDGWVEGASIDSRIINVGGSTGNWDQEPNPDRATAVGELTVNIIVAGIKREFLRCTVTSAVAKDGWLRVGPALEPDTAHTRVGRMGGEAFLTCNAYYDGTNWQRDNTSYGATVFQVRRDGGMRWDNAPAGGVNPTTMTSRGYTTATGDMYIDGTYNTFSPVPPKKDEEMTPDDWLDWALEDARKPHKPYAGIPEDPEEIKRYAKDICKMAIGTARYAEHLREQLKTLEARVASLEALSSRATA